MFLGPKMNTLLSTAFHVFRAEEVRNYCSAEMLHDGMHLVKVFVDTFYALFIYVIWRSGFKSTVVKSEHPHFPAETA